MQLKPLTLVVALALCPVSQAGTFQPGNVAKDAKWIMHMNFDRFRDTQIADAMFEQAESGHGAARMQVFRNLFKLDPRTDFHGMTVYGTDKNEDNAVLVLNTNYDEAALLALLQAGAAYETSTYNGLSLHRFENKNARRGRVRVTKLSWVCFINRDTIVFGNELDRIKAAIDVIGNRRPSLADSAAGVWKMVPDKSAFFAAAADLAALGKAEQHAVVLQQTDGIAINLDEAGENFTASILVSATSEQAAMQISQIVTGFVAMANLSAAEKPENAWLADFTRNLEVNQAGKTVQVSVRHPAADIVDVIRRKAAERQAAE
jgi:hypothetical protein